MATIDYLDYEYIIFSSPLEVNLSFIMSTTDQNTISMIKQQYYPMENETKYKMISNRFTSTYDFNPIIHTYLYQDNNTGQLYTVSIDFTNIEVPESPLQLGYNKLQKQYENLSRNYTELRNLSINIISTLEGLNQTLTNFNNSTRVNMTTKLNILYSEYNLLYSNISILEITLNTTRSDYEKIYENYTIISEEYIILREQYQKINQTLNKTQRNLAENQSKIENLSRNISSFRGFIENLDTPRDVIPNPVTGDYSKTFYSYKQELKKKNNELGMTPVWVGLSVFIVFLIMFFFFLTYINRLRPSPIDQAGMGYTPDAQEYDDFITRETNKTWAEKIKNLIPGKKTRVKTQDHIQTSSPLDSETSKKIDQVLENFKNIQTKVDTIDQRLNAMEDVIDQKTTQKPEKEKKK
jgi:hypothetical protein